MILDDNNTSRFDPDSDIIFVSSSTSLDIRANVIFELNKLVDPISCDI
jgi:hypothetical protein